MIGIIAIWLFVGIVTYYVWFWHMNIPADDVRDAINLILSAILGPLTILVAWVLW